MQKRLLHLGCGALVGKSWHNVDCSPNVFLDNHPWLKWLLWPVLPASAKEKKFVGVEQIDLRRQWHYDANSFDAIFSSHFLEHLSLSDGKHVLKECFRVLKPGGKIRFMVPSLESDVALYLREKKEGNPLAATNFAERTCVFSDYTGPWWYRFYFRLNDKNSHKMFYDSASLESYFREAGFENAVAGRFLESSIPHLSEVEFEDRHRGAACIEANKPPSTAGVLPDVAEPAPLRRARI